VAPARIIEGPTTYTMPQTILPHTATPPVGPERPAFDAEITEDDKPERDPHGPFAALRRMLPKGEVIRFLIVGCCNTLFSILLQAGFGALFTRLYPHASQSWIAIAAVVCAVPFGVTFSFLGFKHFVFRTKGNYLAEWIRCFAVYSPTIPAAILIVGVATKLFELTPLPRPWAKDAAFVVNSGIIAVYSYLGHKKFSFRR
jgi:putative flippase GtrA